MVSTWVKISVKTDRWRVSWMRPIDPCGSARMHKVMVSKTRYKKKKTRHLGILGVQGYHLPYVKVKYPNIHTIGLKLRQ